MALYAISYDLQKIRDYHPIWTKLYSWNAKKLLESLWMVELNATAVEIKDALKSVVDSDDSIAVIELKANSDWACVRVMNLGTDWLRSHLNA